MLGVDGLVGVFDGVITGGDIGPVLGVLAGADTGFAELVSAVVAVVVAGVSGVLGEILCSVGVIEAFVGVGDVFGVIVA